MGWDILPGWKTYLAAIGLLGLSVYQLSVGDLAAAVQNFVAALAAFGVRNAITRNEVAAAKRHTEFLQLHLTK